MEGTDWYIIMDLFSGGQHKHAAERSDHQTLGGKAAPDRFASSTARFEERMFCDNLTGKSR
jgi:hypothetical protein